jgi:hypothetical protein
MPFATISPHARIAALVGVLVIALAGSAFFVLHGHSSPATVTPPATHPHAKTPAPTTPPPMHVVRPTVDPLLPAPLRAQLAKYPIVVAGFYNPDSTVDSLTIQAARAGAAAAHVPFVPVNLLNDAVAGPLTALLPSGELLPNPGFAIYTRQGTLVFRSDGYLDQGAVTQAVKAVAPPVLPTGSTARFYTSNPKAVLAKLDKEGATAPGLAGFSDTSCRLYGGNQRTGWQHFSCAGTVSRAGVTHRITAVATPLSCSRVYEVMTIDGVPVKHKTSPWGKAPFTCKVVR